MEQKWILMYPSLLLAVSILLFFKYSVSRSSSRLPPSPLALPIIGHLYLLKDPIHRILHKLCLKYGPIISLRFGSRLIVVVESSSIIKGCFTGKNDALFANRPLLNLGKHLSFNNNNMVTAPYGQCWRKLRKIYSHEILAPSRLSMYLEIRRNEVKEMLRKLYHKTTTDPSGDSVRVELRTMFYELVYNILARMVAGNNYHERDNFRQGREFIEIVHEVFRLSRVTYPGDFLPILKHLDFQGYEKKIKMLGIKVDSFLQGLIQERRDDEYRETVIDHLLSLQKSDPEFCPDDAIKGLILAMLFAGFDTMAVTIEWAMSLLLNHPQELEKAKREIDTIIGKDQLVDELDLPNLPHLANVISETLRLYPAAPLLLPHMSSENCTIGGFNIPSGTILLVNAWAVHRDPDLWEDPTSFKPERTFQCQGETGSIKYIPFGIGRRACPGSILADRVLQLALASLVQCFEWERVGNKEVDMSEGRGTTMPKATPLEAVCKARPFLSSIIA